MSTSLVKTLLAATVALGLSTFSQAQSVTTAPVGAVTTTLPVGFSLVGLTLVNESLFAGSVASNTVGVLTGPTGVNFATLLSPTAKYYVEVTSGLYEGDRFDVSTASTVSTANNTLTLDTASQNNTIALASNVLSGASFVLRKHITLNDFAAKVTPALTRNNNSASADQVLFYNRNTQAFDTYFLRGDSTWRQLGFTDSVGDTVIIPPGVGIFVRKFSAIGTLTQVGNVRSNNFALPLGTSLSLVAAGHPVSYSPSSLGGTATNGWFGNNNSASADQILTFDSATGSYLTYFLRLDGLTWRQVGFTDDVKTTNVVNFDSAFWLKRNSSDVNYALVKPF